MVYVLYGLEEYLIDKEIKKIILDNKIDDLGIEKYDLTGTFLEQIIDYCNAGSLFSEKKVIIVQNAYILSGTTKKNNLEHNIDSLDKYLQNINEDTILIFTLNSEKLDERKKIVKTLKTKATIKEFNKENNINTIVKTFFEGYNISPKAILKFIDRVGNNLPLLESEAEKLKIYKIDTKEINENDIENTINKNVDLDIFTLIDNIVLKNKVKAIESYNEMIKYGEEPIKILIMLASQFRIMLQTKLLYKKGYSEKDMASVLAIHPYRIKLALEKAKNFKESELIDFIETLADLDSKIKQSEVDKKLAIELFMLKI